MHKQSVDIPLAMTVTVLLLMGMVMVFSASSMVANFQFGSLTYFFRKQLVWGVVAMLGMVAISRIHYRHYQRYALPLWMVGISILLLFGLFFFGRTVNGATRWYHFGFFRFQPSELTRLSLIVYTAYYLSRRKKKLEELKTGFLPLALVVGVNAFLILLQPDLSTAMMICLIAGVMMFVSPIPLRHLLSAVLALLPFLVFIISRSSYQWMRLKGWWTAMHDPTLAPYQLKQSLIGIGRGGVLGQGLGQSKQKFLFLPDSHTDFIFSIMGEEWGFVGVSVILILFLIIFLRGMRIANRAPDRFSRYLALGLTLNFTLYAFVNAGVVSALLPTTGLPMPFFSYGGSNLFFQSLAAGILLNISRYRHDQLAGGVLESHTNPGTNVRHRLSDVIITAE